MASEAIEAAYTTYYLHCNKAYTDFIISYLTRQMARKSLFCSWRSRMFIILLLYLPIRIENRNTYNTYQVIVFENSIRERNKYLPKYKLC